MKVLMSIACLMVGTVLSMPKHQVDTSSEEEGKS
jgi:hypothetical protein